jgi:hypothetical protein
MFEPAWLLIVGTILVLLTVAAAMRPMTHGDPFRI